MAISQDFFRKLASGVFASGATLSMGFLSFAGMFLVSPVLGWCITALVLAVAYEGQVFNEGISNALRRMFDENHLKKGLAAREINEFLNSKEFVNNATLKKNLFLKTYAELQSYINQIEENHHLDQEWSAKKAEAEQQLDDLKLDFIEQVKNIPKLGRTPYYKEKVIADLFEIPEMSLLKGDERIDSPYETKKKLINREELLTEINRKQWLIRFSWIFAIAGGIASGFAAFSAIVEGVTKLSVAYAAISVIPSALLVGLAVFAAFGYAFMLYQTMAEIIQEYDGKWQQIFQRGNDSAIRFGLRLAGTIAIISLGLFATIATAGTWWQLTNKGAVLFKLGESAAQIIRDISVPLMAVGTLAYNVKNSLSTVSKIGKSNMRAVVDELINKIQQTREEEKSLIQFLNPFRIIEKIINGMGRTILYLGHAASDGLSADQIESINPIITATITGSNAALVDANFLPEKHPHEQVSHQHNHDVGHNHNGHHHAHEHKHEHGHHHNHSSKLLDVIFLPLTAVVYTFKFLAVLWDRPFTGDWNKSWEKSFGEEKWKQPEEAPKLIEQWRSSHSTIRGRGIEVNTTTKAAYQPSTPVQPIPVREPTSSVASNDETINGHGMRRAAFKR